MEENRLERVKLCKDIEDKTNVISSKLEEHKTEMEKGLGAVRKEMSSSKQGVTEKTINTLKEKVKVAERDSSAKLEELSARPDKLQEQVTVGCRQVEPSVGSNEQALRMNVATGGEEASCSSRVGDLGEDHVRNRQESMNGCRVNVEHLPVLCNVSGSDANLSHKHEFTNKNLDKFHGNLLSDLI
jgi:hypothetical protein